MMNEQVYNALKAIAVPDELAQAAAKSLAEPLTDVLRDVAVLKWMMAFNIGLSSAILFKLFLH